MSINYDLYKESINRVDTLLYDLATYIGIANNALLGEQSKINAVEGGNAIIEEINDQMKNINAILVASNMKKARRIKCCGLSQFVRRVRQLIANCVPWKEFW